MLSSALGKQGEARTQELCRLMGEFTLQNNPAAVAELCAAFVADTAQDFNLAQARRILSAQVEVLLSRPESASPACVEESLRAIQTRLSSLEEQDVQLRDALASVLINSVEDCARAAKVLSQVQLGSSKFTDAERAQRLVRIAELYLEDGLPVDAEAFVNRASLVMDACKHDLVLQTRFQVSYARMLDAKRKFVEASSRYYQLSLPSDQMEVEEQDLNTLLSKAIVCAILGNAGPNRSRVLGLIFKDSRTEALQGGIFADLLEKMYLDRLISSSDTERKMAPFLERHQKATGADGSTILQRAIVEHNVLAASKVYANISLVSLGQLLEIGPERAEKIVGKMIIEERLVGASIDQIDGNVTFASALDSAGQFDAQIAFFCDTVSTLAERIQAKHPELAIQ